jgi:hypothetical protein
MVEGGVGDVSAMKNRLIQGVPPVLSADGFALDSTEATSVALRVACANLPIHGTAASGRIDPIACLFTRERNAKKFAYASQTEILLNDRNPTFQKCFVLDYQAPCSGNAVSECYSTSTQ